MQIKNGTPREVPYSHSDHSVQAVWFSYASAGAKLVRRTYLLVLPDTYTSELPVKFLTQANQCLSESKEPSKIKEKPAFSVACGRSWWYNYECEVALNY